MSDEFRINVDMMHLMSGLEGMVMEKVEVPVNYFPEFRILVVRERIKDIKAEMWIEYIWNTKSSGKMIGV